MVRLSTIIFALCLSAAPTLALWIPNEHEHAVLAPRGNCIGTLDKLAKACQDAIHGEQLHRAEQLYVAERLNLVRQSYREKQLRDAKSYHRKPNPRHEMLYRQWDRRRGRSEPEPEKYEKQRFIVKVGAKAAEMARAGACDPESSASSSGSSCSSSGEETDTGGRSAIPGPGNRQTHDAEASSSRQGKPKTLQ